MKIDIHVLCKNEIKLAPFFIDYWNALANDVNVYIYDGLSSDGCRELFNQYDNIHIIDFEPDALDDGAHVRLKNTCWKKSNADFVMVCDFDETIFSYNIETLHSELQYMKDNDYSILVPLSFNMITEEFPKYEKGKYLHEIAQYGFNDCSYNAKPILFDPHKIKEINYVPGGHTCHPQGDVKYYISEKLFFIHAKYLGFNYFKERIDNRILSEWNKKCGLFGEKDKSSEQMIIDFNNKFSKRFKFDDIKNNFKTYYKNRLDWSPWGQMKINL